MQNDAGVHNLALEKQRYLMLNPQFGDANGINVFTLLADLYKKRWLVIGITGFCTLLAVIIALMIPPQYQVKTLLVKPHPSQYQSLYVNTNSSLTGANLFAEFLKTLSKKSNYIQFLQDSGLLEKSLKNPKTASENERKNVLNALSQNFNISIINHYKNDPKDAFKDDSLEAELTTRSNKLDLQAMENKSYIEYTNKQVLSNITEGARSITNRKIQHLEKSIALNEIELSTRRHNDIKRLKDKQALKIALLHNKIAALKEADLRVQAIQQKELSNALKIADALGIKTYYAQSPNKLGNKDLIIDVNTNPKELYLRGSDYLKTLIAISKTQKHSIGYESKLSTLEEKLYLAMNNKKIIALEERTDDKPYIKNIEKKQSALKRLQALSFDLSDIKSYSIIGTPIVEVSPIKPNKKLIVLMGFILGFMIATLLIILSNAYLSRTQLDA